MNTCERLREELKAYLDGELSTPQRLTLRLHLARCAACQEEIQVMEQISSELRAGETEGLTPALRDRLLAGIPDRPAGTPTEAPKPRWRLPALPNLRRRPLLAWGAVASITFLWFGYHAVRAVWQPDSLSPIESGASSESVRVMSAPDHSAMSAASSPAPAAEGPAAPPMPAREALGGRERRETLKSRTVPVESSQARESSLMRSPLADAGRASENSLVPSERQVHRQADITMAVAKVEESSESVEAMVKTAGGYVASSQLSTEENGVKIATLTTKVPVAGFDAFLGRVSRLGEVQAKNVSGEDLTAQISDEMQTRRALFAEIEEAEAKLREARTQAQRREDREALRELRVQKAQAEGRLELLKKMAALATITVTLQEKAKANPAPPQTGGFLDELGETGRAAFRTFLQAAKLPVFLLIWVAAFSPVLILLAIAYRYAART